MSDLISRAALLEFAHNHIDGQVDCNDIARFPSVDAEPVRHGRWITVCDTHGVTEDDGWWREWYAKCSKCGRMIPLNEYICETQSPEKALTEYPYCHCGAKMDGA